MKFIEFAHPEGGTFIVHVDHITSAHYRRGDGEMKTRLGLDLDERQSEIILLAKKQNAPGKRCNRCWKARLNTCPL